MAKQHLDRLYDAGRSGSAINRDRKNLGAAWKWGKDNLRDWPDTENPFLAVVRYPERTVLRYVPPEEDFWKVTDYLEGLCASGDPAHIQNYTMHMAFLHLAARRSEIFRLALKDLDFDSGMARLWTRKRAGGRLEFDWVPITRELKGHLLNWIEVKLGLKIKSESVFVCMENTPFCADYYGQPFTVRQHFMKKVCKRAGVKPFGFHAIRHFTASYLYGSGQSVSVIQQILRHKSPNTTTRYLRKLGLETDGVRNALESLGKKAEVIPLERKVF
jgi:integrase